MVGRNPTRMVRGVPWQVLLVLVFSAFLASRFLATTAIRESVRNKPMTTKDQQNRTTTTSREAPIVRAKNTATTFTSGSTTMRLRNHHETALAEYDHLSSSELVPLAKDKESFMANDILSMWHDPTEASILIYLRSNATCRNPALRGRLSGPALILLREWESVDNASHPPGGAGGGFVLRKATYEAPLAGPYFLEIVGLLCNDWSAPYQPIPKHGLPDSARHQNLKRSCLVHPREHRITEPGVRIRVSHPDRLDGSRNDSFLGFWKWSAPVGNASSSSSEPYPFRDSDHSPSPVYTRWQPPECYLEPGQAEEDLDTAECDQFVGMDRFRNWEWSWRIPINGSLVQKVSQQTQVCFVGWSHSRVLIEQAKINSWGAHWVGAKYPFYVNSELMREHYCDVAVVGVGQWAFSSRIDNITLDMYSGWIDDMLTNVTAPSETNTLLNPKDPPYRLRRVILRSLHDNPLGDRKLRCPSVDHRNPVTMSAANRILLERVRAYQAKTDQESNGEQSNVIVEYLDTNRIVAPMWDAGEDWNHVGPTVSNAELLYILAFALDVLPEPALDPEHGFHDQGMFA